MALGQACKKIFTRHALPLKSDDPPECQARVQLDHCEQTVRNESSIGIGISTRGWSPEYVNTCEVEGGRKRKPRKSAPKSRQRQAIAYVRVINRSRVSRWIDRTGKRLDIGSGTRFQGLPGPQT